MLIFSLSFWKTYIANPKAALEILRKKHNKILYSILNLVAFVRIVFSEYFLNHCLTRASAVAFALLLTLIPLLVCISFMLTKVMDVRLPIMEKVVEFFLPFAPQAILNNVGVFFANAQKVKGLGIGALIVITLGMFTTVEESFNTIWKVTSSRSFFIRLRTFTMVMVYSPILFFASFQMRHSVILDVQKVYIYSLDVLSFVLTVLAFTVFIWVVPNTKVKFKSALIGGLVSGILFELERQWFFMYVNYNSQTQTIYGAFGIFMFFLASLFFAACFILFGAQVAFVAQNFNPLLRAQKRWERRISDFKTYLSLRIMVDTIHTFLRKKKPPTLAYFMKKYEMTENQANGIVNSLVHRGYMHIVINKSDGKETYVPTQNYGNICVRELLDSIEDENRSIPITPDDFGKKYISSIVSGVKDRPSSSTDDITFDKIIYDIEAGEMEIRRLAKMGNA